MTRPLCVACLFSLLTSMTSIWHSENARPLQRGSESSEALARARSAITRDRDLESVRAILLKGRRLNRNQWYGPGNRAPEFIDNPVELRILFPDHFLSIMGRGLSGRLETTGFRGDKDLYGKPAQNYQQQFVARLALGTLLRTDATIPLWLERSSTASVLTFRGRDGFRTDVLLDAETGLPSKLRHEDRRVRDGSRINVEWVLEDHRTTSGVKLPHRVTRMTDGERFDVYTFESWTIDPPLKPEDFVLPR